eukprot:m.157992 g.157992  ORF g.157992 m.157992 type:complete len:464 (-) comp23679_c0_seq2:479-1870(-)
MPLSSVWHPDISVEPDTFTPPLRPMWRRTTRQHGTSWLGAASWWWCIVAWVALGAQPSLSDCEIQPNSIGHVAIPDSMTSIESAAFVACVNMTSITIPDSVTSIGAFAFQDCTGLTSVTLADSVAVINASCFIRCSSLVAVNLSSSLQVIPAFAFEGATRLASVNLTAITSVHPTAFSNCACSVSVYTAGADICNCMPIGCGSPALVSDAPTSAPTSAPTTSPTVRPIAAPSAVPSFVRPGTASDTGGESTTSSPAIEIVATAVGLVIILLVAIAVIVGRQKTKSRKATTQLQPSTTNPEFSMLKTTSSAKMFGLSSAHSQSTTVGLPGGPAPTTMGGAGLRQPHDTTIVVAPYALDGIDYSIPSEVGRSDSGQPSTGHKQSHDSSVAMVLDEVEYAIPTEIGRSDSGQPSTGHKQSGTGSVAMALDEVDGVDYAIPSEIGHTGFDPPSAIYASVEPDRKNHP